ncbi:MAG: hypothetical protein OEZ16_07060 [Chromatiales bacterium]|nr:hypothetical protein [Chromatiales bacterium]
MKALNPRKISAALILIGGVALLQYHAILFWTEVVDPLTGWAWSLLLEGAALWCWSHPRFSIRSLGAVATVLVLAGPLYQVSAPLVEEHVSVDKSAEQRTVITAEVAALEQALNTFLSNSEKRIGWSGRIDSTQQQLTAARAELRQLTSAEPERMAWQRQAIILMQAIALVLFQLLNVIMIRTLSEGGPILGVQTKGGRRHPQLAVVNTAR